MRVPIIVTVVLLVAFAGLGWHKQRTIAALRTTHETLAAEAASRGIFPDPADSARVLPESKTPRPDREAEARRVAGEIVAYASEMEDLLTRVKFFRDADEAARRRGIEQMDEVMALDGEQLKIVIDEVFAGSLDDRVRLNLVTVLIRFLTRDHPREALEILTASPGMVEFLEGGSARTYTSLTSNALRGWARIQPAEALAWFREHRGSLSENSLRPSQFSLIDGMATGDLRLALDALDEFDVKPSHARSMMGNCRENPAQWNTALAALREWSATLSDEKTREDVFHRSLVALILGKGSQSAGFHFTTQGIEGAGLSLKELEFFIRPDLLDLSYYIESEQGGQWIAWLGDTFPIAQARRRIRQLVKNFRTSSAIEKWIATAPDGPTRHVAIGAYAETVKPANHETAIRWALTLPEGAERAKTLKVLHERWPQNDGASGEAAAAFAREHGIGAK